MSASFFLKHYSHQVGNWLTPTICHAVSFRARRSCFTFDFLVVLWFRFWFRFTFQAWGSLQGRCLFQSFVSRVLPRQATARSWRITSSEWTSLAKRWSSSSRVEVIDVVVHIKIHHVCVQVGHALVGPHGHGTLMACNNIQDCVVFGHVFFPKHCVKRKVQTLKKLLEYTCDQGRTRQSVLL